MKRGKRSSSLIRDESMNPRKRRKRANNNKNNNNKNNVNNYQCNGKTKKGVRCKNKTKEIDGYCFLHVCQTPKLLFI